MSPPVRSWIAMALLAFVGTAAVRPAIAVAEDDEPTVTPSGGEATRAPVKPPAASGPPPGASFQTAPAQAAPNPGYPPPGYPPPGYPPPGYAYPPPGYPPGYPPPGYGPPAYLPAQLVKVHRARRGMVAGGAVTFGVSYGVAVTVAYINETIDCDLGNCADSSARYLWIPVAGPVIAASADSSVDLFPMIFWSGAQAAGVVMFIYGIIGREVMEYRIPKLATAVQLAPLFTRDAGGMALTARW